MNGTALNSDDLFQDDAEVLALPLSAGEGSRHIFPYHKSGPNMDTCPAS